MKPTATTRLTETDAGRSIRLRAGDQLEITLASNPTTGYQWEAGAGDTTVLQQLGQPLFVPGSGALGSRSQVTLTYEAVGAGIKRPPMANALASRPRLGAKYSRGL